MVQPPRDHQYRPIALRKLTLYDHSNANLKLNVHYTTPYKSVYGDSSATDDINSLPIDDHGCQARDISVFRFSSFGFQLLDVEGDGSCFFRCLSLVLFGMESYHYYFRDLLRIALLSLSRVQVLTLYTMSSNPLSRLLVAEVENYRDLVFLDRDNPNEHELWSVHCEFIKLLRKYDSWVSEIHIYLLDIFFGINIRVWSVSHRPLPPDVQSVLEERQFLPIPKSNSERYQRLVLNKIHHIVKKAIVEMEASSIPFIELRSDIRAQYDSVSYLAYRFFGFRRMNILIDLLIRQYDHYNVIHWSPDERIVNSNRYPINDIIHHKAIPAYSILDSVSVSYPFHYDDRNLAPIVVEARLQPDSYSLSYFLDVHLNFLIEKYQLLTSQDPGIAVELKSRRSLVRKPLIERKAKLI
jgi:hypothetical protein